MRLNDTQTALVQLLRENGGLYRNQLAELLGISLMGVSKSLAPMERGRLVTWSPSPNGSPGRPSKRVDLAEEGGCGLGIHVAHLEVAVSVVNLKNRVVFFRQIPFSFRALSASDPEGGLAPFWELLDGARAAAPGRRLMAVGLSLSGDFDFATGRIMKAYDFLSAEQAEAFRKRVADEAGHPVTLVHDTEAELIAERWCNPFLPARPTLLSVSDRLGVSLMFDGRLFRGSPSWRRWVGHCPVPSSREEVPHFLPGPLAATASSAAWTDLMQGVHYGHRAPVAPDVERRELDAFYERFRRNDPGCRDIVRRGMADLAVVVRNLCFLVPLDAIVVNGWIPEVLNVAIEEIRGALCEGERANGQAMAEMSAPVYAATLGEGTEAAGAAFFALDELFSGKMETRGWKRRIPEAGAPGRPPRRSSPSLSNL